MDRYFKMERAHERLNIEIQRVLTHMHDEEIFLRAKEEELRSIDPVIAHQVFLYREERTRYNCQHRQRFKKLAADSHFTGSLAIGVPLDDSLRKDLPASMDVDVDDSGQDSDEENEEDWVQEMAEAMQTLFIQGD
ncbi:hypothetical protein C0991_010181 [Blastosporella zonata]|nr:hypothetical protein C0991_010181 [Blastosporella zonata]